VWCVILFVNVLQNRFAAAHIGLQGRVKISRNAAAYEKCAGAASALILHHQFVAMPKQELEEGVDFYRDEQGRYVFTAKYLRDRGYCCGSGCRHCPYTNAEREAARNKRIQNKIGGWF
jgi:hypothetical protein